MVRAKHCGIVDRNPHSVLHGNMALKDNAKGVA